MSYFLLVMAENGQTNTPWVWVQYQILNTALSSVGCINLSYHVMSVMVVVVLLMVISNNIQKPFVDGVDAMSEIYNIQTINLKK